METALWAKYVPCALDCVFAIINASACDDPGAGQFTRASYGVDTLDYRTENVVPILAKELARIDGMVLDLVQPSPVGGVVLLDDGGIAVTQSQNQQVLFFDSLGNAAGSFGRAGDGPGEFRSVSRSGCLQTRCGSGMSGSAVPR